MTNDQIEYMKSKTGVDHVFDGRAMVVKNNNRWISAENNDYKTGDSIAVQSNNFEQSNVFYLSTIQKVTQRGSHVVLDISPGRYESFDDYPI